MIKIAIFVDPDDIGRIKVSDIDTSLGYIHFFLEWVCMAVNKNVDYRVSKPNCDCCEGQFDLIFDLRDMSDKPPAGLRPRNHGQSDFFAQTFWNEK